jgi:nucleotide-binding universal stress UspA family protein
MKTILVPVDFSDCSALAVRFAVNLQKKISGNIVLLHVLDEGETDTSLGTTGSWAGAEDVPTVPYMMARLKHVKLQMQSFMKENGLMDLAVEDVIEVGDPAMKINAGADKHGADIIVMGTHGTKDHSNLFIGSVADKVVQHANRPVLSIRELQSVDPTPIVFASDFTEESDRIFDKVKEFASLFGSELQLLKIVDEDDAKLKTKVENALTDFCNRHNCGDLTREVIYASKTEEGILLYSKRVGAQLIALGTHGRKGLSRFFNGSVSAELVNHSFCPVLTINLRS